LGKTRENQKGSDTFFGSFVCFLFCLVQFHFEIHHLNPYALNAIAQSSRLCIAGIVPAAGIVINF